MHFRDLVKPYTNAPLNRQVILDILKDYKRPNDKISELIKSGELTPLKKGLYIPGIKTDLPGPETFLIANHLWGPSYVSLESAMSYWGLIPERAYEWYDLEWYIKKGIPLDLRHFKLRAKDTGDWSQEEITPVDGMSLLRGKFKAVSFNNVKKDVVPFIKDDAVLEIWDKQYFNDLADKLKFQ